MKHPQTNFHADTMNHSTVNRPQKSKFIIRSEFIIRSKFSCSRVFYRYRYFIKVTTTNFDLFFQV